MTCVLIVEDDNIQRRIIGRMLDDQGYEVRAAEGGAEALTLIDSPAGAEVDLVLLDLEMPTVSGLEVLNRITETRPELPVIILTSHAEVDRVVEVMRAGAADFIAKPPLPEKLHAAIDKALARCKPAEDHAASGKTQKKIGFEDLMGQSPALRKAVATARKGAASNIPILIEGESGVGKEMFARAIQSESDRADKPFIVVNCGAIPANLVESILFGHEKGAFTGAVEKHEGKFQEASGGTLFLDEIGELPLETQVKLLRAIQEGVVDPVGSRTPVKVDIRLISATNKALIEQVGRGEFREDLMYRLNVFPVHIPPLRQRREDIPLLVAYSARKISAAQNCPSMTVSPQAMALLAAYDWPGNVRQLENAMFRAMILAEGAVLGVEDFPLLLSNATKAETVAKPTEWSRPVLAHSNDIKHPAPARPEAMINLFDAAGELRPLADVEAEIIEKALSHYNGHMSEIARRLGIGRSTLYRKMTEMGLDGDPFMPQRSQG